MLVKKKSGKLRVSVNYRKLNACIQKDFFPLSFNILLLEEVSGRAHFIFMDSYAYYNHIFIAL